MEEFLVLEMPIFRPQYKKWEKYGYMNVKEKDRLKNVLVECSDGYCMYCFTRLHIDGKLYGNLEHAIEKGNSDQLIECIPNIGLSCSVCNQSFKRIGEQNRKIPENIINEYEIASKCSEKKRKQCTVPCKSLRMLQKSYINMPNAQIILQPMGIKGEDSGEELAVQYNVINMEFEPAVNRHTYSNKEIRFIYAHIRRFRLNDPKYRTHQLFDFVKNVIDNDGKMPEYEYNNLVVELFRKKLSDKSRKEILKICESIYIITFPKMHTKRTIIK